MSEENGNQSRAIDGGISGDGLGDITLGVTVEVYNNSGTELLAKVELKNSNPQTDSFFLSGNTLSGGGSLSSSTLIYMYKGGGEFAGLAHTKNQTEPDITDGESYQMNNKYLHRFYVVAYEWDKGEYESAKVEYNGKILGVVTKGCPLTLNCADKPMKSNVGISATKMKRNPKNLISLPYVTKSTTMNGITYTVRDDGSVKVEGTSTDYSQFYFHYGEFFELSAGEYVTISGGTNEISLNLRRLDADGNSKWFLTSHGNTETGTLLEGERINSCNIYISKAGITVNTIIKPMLVKGADAEPYYCSTWGRNPKNLIPFDYADRGKTSGGITYTVNNDGSVTLNGLSTAPSEIVLAYDLDLPIGIYTYKLNLSHYVWNIFGYVACSLDGAWAEFPNPITVSSDRLTRTFEITQDMIDAGYKIRLNIYVQDAGVQADNLIIKPMLNKGTEPLPYHYYEEFAW